MIYAFYMHTVGIHELSCITPQPFGEVVETDVMQTTI